VSAPDSAPIDLNPHGGPVPWPAPAEGARAPSRPSQRDLVLASLLRCPGRDRRASGPRFR
jgi:hypothetical protein